MTPLEISYQSPQRYQSLITEQIAAITAHVPTSRFFRSGTTCGDAYAHDKGSVNKQ